MTPPNWEAVADVLAKALIEVWGDRHTGTCQSCGDDVQEDPSLHFGRCPIGMALQGYAGSKGLAKLAKDLDR